MANNRKLKFPSDLNSSSNQSGFIKLVALEWNVKNKRDINVENTSNIIDTIFLPLPTNGLEDSYSISWEEDTGLGAGGVVDALKHVGFSSLKNMLGGIGAKVSYQEGKALNDLASASFQNVEFRTHDFSWDLIPSNKKDADTLNKIIKSFKRNSLSKQQSDNILLFPAFWNISVYSVNFNEIMSYKMSVCTSVSDDQMPDSIDAFHDDGNAVKVTLNISIKELFRQTADDIID